MKSCSGIFLLFGMIFFLGALPVSARDTTKVKKADWFENPGYSRYVMTPTAIPLRKNTGYYQTQYGIAHTVRYALTGNINVSGGTEIISLISRKSPPSYFYAGMVTSEKYRTFFPLGIPYAMLTINFGGKEKEEVKQVE